MVLSTTLSGSENSSSPASPIAVNNNAFSWLESLIKWTGALPNKDLNEREIYFSLPNEAISCIFHCFTDPKSFANFAVTSEQHHQVSKHLSSINAFSSYSLRKFWFIRDIHFNDALKRGVYAESVSKVGPGLRQSPGVKIPASGSYPNMDPLAGTQPRELSRSPGPTFETLSVYEAFNQRCSQIGINNSSKDYGFYVRAAINHFVKTSGSKSRDVTDPIAISFGKSIYNDMINSYAALPPSEITIDSFNTKAAQIKDLFSDDSIVDIEASMRHALTKNYGETFSELRKKHQFFIKTDPYSASLKKHYEQQLNAEKEVLCGSRDVLEVTNEALEKMKNAYFELNEAKESYLDRIAQLMSPISFSRRAEFSSLENLLNLIDGGSLSENPDSKLHRMGRQIRFLYAQHANAKRQFKQLSLLQLRSINPDANFMLEFGMMSKFYEEMCQDVTTENKEERHLALHAIG